MLNNNNNNSANLNPDSNSAIPENANEQNLNNKVASTGSPKKARKKTSALVAASMWRSAVGAVKAHSSRDIRGSASGLADTGTIMDYD